MLRIEEEVQYTEKGQGRSSYVCFLNVYHRSCPPETLKRCSFGLRLVTKLSVTSTSSRQPLQSCKSCHSIPRRLSCLYWPPFYVR